MRCETGILTLLCLLSTVDATPTFSSVATGGTTPAGGIYWNAAAIGTKVYFPPYMLAAVNLGENPNVGVFDTATQLFTTVAITARGYSGAAAVNAVMLSCRDSVLSKIEYPLTPSFHPFI